MHLEIPGYSGMPQQSTSSSFILVHNVYLMATFMENLSIHPSRRVMDSIGNLPQDNNKVITCLDYRFYYYNIKITTHLIYSIKSREHAFAV